DQVHHDLLDLDATHLALERLLPEGEAQIDAVPVQGRTHDLHGGRDQSTELGALDAALAAMQQAADVSDETTRPVRLCARLVQQVENLRARGAPLYTDRGRVQQVGDRAEGLAHVMSEARCQIASRHQPEKLGDTAAVSGCEPLLR